MDTTQPAQQHLVKSDRRPPLTKAQLLKPTDEIEIQWHKGTGGWLDRRLGLHEPDRLTLRFLDEQAARKELKNQGIEVASLRSIAQDIQTGAGTPKTRCEIDETAVPEILPPLVGMLSLVGLLALTACGLDLLVIITGLVVAVVMFLSMLGLTWRSNYKKDVRRRREAVNVLHRHIHEVTLRDPVGYRTEIRLLERTRAAVIGIENTPVWSDSLFDDHRVRLNLREEKRLIESRIASLLNIRYSSGISGKNDSVRAIWKETETRVAALERYWEQVRVAELELKELKAAQAEEYGNNRLADLVASTGGDYVYVNHIDAMSRDANATSAAIREVVAIMRNTLTAFATTPTAIMHSATV